MKNLIIVLSVFLTVITVASAQTTTKKESPETIYICPTHPGEMNSSSGKCPKCGMELVKKGTKKKAMMMKGCGMMNM